MGIHHKNDDFPITIEMNLQLRLAQKVLESLGNNHSDNWDEIRFGPEKQGEAKNIFPSKLELLNTRGYFHFEQSRGILTYANSALEKYWKGLEETYDILSDDKSKEIYIELLAYFNNLKNKSYPIV